MSQSRPDEASEIERQTRFQGKLPIRRIVMDTNVLVGSAYNDQSASRRLVNAVLKRVLTLVVSPAVKHEYEYILPRVIRDRDELERVNTLIAQAVVVQPAETPRVVPDDPQDDKLLAAAVAGQVDALISNDHHLLEWDGYEGVRVLRPSEFELSAFPPSRGFSTDQQ